MRVGACPSLPTDDPTCPTQEYCPSVLPAACPNSLRRLVTLSLGRRSLLEHGGRRPRSRGGAPWAAPATAISEVHSVRAVGSQGGVRAAVLGREMVDSLGAIWVPGPAPTVARAAPPASAVWGADGQSLGRSLSVSRRPLEGSRGASKGLRPLHRMRGSALARGCGRGGRVVLPVPLARAAAVSTRLRVLFVSEARSSCTTEKPPGLCSCSCWIRSSRPGSGSG